MDKDPIIGNKKQSMRQKITELSSSQRTDVPVNTVPREHAQDAMKYDDNSVTYSIPENSGKIKEGSMEKRNGHDPAKIEFEFEIALKSSQKRS